MLRHAPRGLACIVAAISGTSLLAQARTDYMNVESPQVSPITTMTAFGRTLLLVCNTPDNSLEIWNTDETIAPVANRFIERVPVGLEPVSVTVAGNRFWTANFLGDSITAGRLEVDAQNNLHARITASRNLPSPVGFQRGDEPMDVACANLGPNGLGGPEVILVSMFSSSSIAMLDANSLLPIGVPAIGPIKAVAPAVGGVQHGIKEPRAIRIKRFGNEVKVVVLATKGGVTHPDSMHDLDVLIGTVTLNGVDFTAPPNQLNQLGSTNYNMRFASNGELFLVGAEAMNFDAEDKPKLRNEATGFVKSMLYRVALPPTIYRRDANLAAGQVVVPKAGLPVEGKPLATLTDLALLESGGVVNKIYVAAMGSDRIGVFSVPSTGGIDVATWNRRTIDLPASTLNGGPRFGPRGLTILPQTNRLYVLNRMDNSVVVVDTSVDQVLPAQSYALRHDPTPNHVKQGRRFLYDAELSGTGFVSCASCHVDGRTDALAWRLGDSNHGGIPGVPAELPPTPAFITSIMGTGTFDIDTPDPDYELAMLAGQTFDPNVPGDGDPNEDKREMVTQSLQGLLNFEVGLDARDLFTNAPFHWRGDKPSVRDFNEAFVTLLGMDNVGDASTGPQGLKDDDMNDFEQFVHSIVYPPNPKQPKDRTYAPGTSAELGLRLFHTVPGPLGGRSCVQCHALPEGSNNRLTVFALDPKVVGFVSLANRQPIESAALRGLFQKEPLLDDAGVTNPNAPIVGHFGLNHNGLQPLTMNLDPVTGRPRLLTSINAFVDAFDRTFNQGPAISFTDRVAIKTFVHQMDWGLAPMVGEVCLIDDAVMGNSVEMAIAFAKVEDMRTQANLANAGLVCLLLSPTASGPTARLRGFRWAPSVLQWVEEPGFAFLGDSSLLALRGAGDSLLVMSVPLGSEQRIAAPTGTPSTLPAIQPQGVDLVGLVTDTAYAAVPALEELVVPKRWATATPPAPPGNTFNGSATYYFDFQSPHHIVGSASSPVDDVFQKTLRMYQFGLLDGQNPQPPLAGAQASNGLYGVTKLRHEAPRRIRVVGTGILMGATLELGIPDAASGPGNTVPSQWHTLPNPPMRTIELPIHPRRVGTQLVWETAAELDPMMAYQMMLGGPMAPGVASTITDVIVSEHNATPPLVTEPAPGQSRPFLLPFRPNDFNWYRIVVRNPGTGAVSSAPVFRQLKML